MELLALDDEAVILRFVKKKNVRASIRKIKCNKKEDYQQLLSMAYLVSNGHVQRAVSYRRLVVAERNKFHRNEREHGRIMFARFVLLELLSSSVVSVRMFHYR